MTSTERRQFDDQEVGRAVNPAGGRESAGPEQPTFEGHYRIGELAQVWKLGRETVRRLVREEHGVIKIRLGRKKAHTIYSSPESVAVRIHTRLLTACHPSALPFLARPILTMPLSAARAGLPS